MRILAAERQQVVDIKPQGVTGVAAEGGLDEGRAEAVETRCHGDMGGEEIAGARDGESQRECLAAVHHEAAGALQHREGGMSLVKMADLGVETKGAQQPPSADAQHQLLRQAELRTATVELASDAAVGGQIGRVVPIQQIELHAPDLHLPGAQPASCSQASQLRGAAIRHWRRGPV